MNKLKTTKLKLDRETLVPLQSETLDNVNGGNISQALTTIVTRVSCLSCTIVCVGK